VLGNYIFKGSIDTTENIKVGKKVLMGDVVATGITDLVRKSLGEFGIHWGESDPPTTYPKAYITAFDNAEMTEFLTACLNMYMSANGSVVLESLGDQINGEWDGLIRLNAKDVSLQQGSLRFPVDQIPSSNPNTLDDYEEGTWTPTLVGTTTAGAGTYTTQLGKYTKIGNVVNFIIQLVWTAHTGTGNLRISNLPFTSANDGISTPCTIVSSALTYSGQLAALIPPNTTRLNLHSNATNTALGSVAMDTTGTIYVQGSYTV
jgi:hypothetical protein